MTHLGLSRAWYMWKPTFKPLIAMHGELLSLIEPSIKWSKLQWRYLQVVVNCPLGISVTSTTNNILGAVSEMNEVFHCTWIFLLDIIKRGSGLIQSLIIFILLIWMILSSIEQSFVTKLTWSLRRLCFQKFKCIGYNARKVPVPSFNRFMFPV